MAAYNRKKAAKKPSRRRPATKRPRKTDARKPTRRLISLVDSVDLARPRWSSIGDPRRWEVVCGQGEVVGAYASRAAARAQIKRIIADPADDWTVSDLDSLAVWDAATQRRTDEIV